MVTEKLNPRDSIFRRTEALSPGNLLGVLPKIVTTVTLVTRDPLTSHLCLTADLLLRDGCDDRDDHFIFLVFVTCGATSAPLFDAGAGG